MSESQSSLPEEQTESGRMRSPSGPNEIRTLVHDVRSPLSVVTTSLELIDMDLPPGHQAREALVMAKDGVELATTMLKDAAERALPEHALRNVHAMLAVELKRLCVRDPQLAHICTFEDCDSPTWDSKADAAAKEVGSAPLRVILHALPPELMRDKIPCSKEAVRRIFDNLIKNAHRKKARVMHISFSRSGYHEVCLSVSDDSEGMKLRILNNLRKGISDTDKTPEDGIDPGQTSENHGLGVASVRQIVVDQGGGKMDIFSVKKSGTEDPDGDAQDAQSLEEHPFKHGTTFRFMYEVKNLEPNGEHGPSQSVQEQRLFTRRRVFQMAAAGTAVAAVTLGATALHLYTHSSRRESAQDGDLISPISDIEVDEEGNLLSFAFNAYGANAVYRRGQRVPDPLKDVQTVRYGQGSVTAIESQPIDGLRIPPAFVCTTPRGVFADVRLFSDRSPVAASLCMLRAPGAGTMHPSRSHLYPKVDTVAHPRARSSDRPVFDATSVDMLQSRALEAMYGPLSEAAEHVLLQSQSPLARVRPVLRTVLDMRKALRERIVEASNSEELRRHLGDTDRFILADKSVIDDLRLHPIEPALTRGATERGNRIALRGVSPTEASSMLQA